MALTAVSTEAYAVISTMLSSGSAAASRVCSSIPSMPGILMSRNAMS